MSSASGRNPGNVAWNAEEERKCRERFMELFEKGYAHRFEFLGGRTSSKGRARLRCKVCGHEFEKPGSFAQMGSNIYCPHCHAYRDSVLDVPHDGRLADHLAEMYASGMKASDIAAATGIQDRYVRRILKEGGIEFNTNRYRTIDKEKRKAEREATREAERARRAAIIESFEPIADELDGAKADGILASAIRNAPLRQRCFAKTERFIETFAPTWETCSYCGETYMFFPSMEKFGRKKAGPYCSKRCYRKSNKRSSNIGHRLRKYGSEDKPRDSIKLDKLIERDNGICYICGCETNRDDHNYRHGWFTIGDSYPTIDHVMPLAKGGTHTWDNVRLACRRCNSEKGDTVMAGPHTE